jgi:hypothetical protein
MSSEEISALPLLGPPWSAPCGVGVSGCCEDLLHAIKGGSLARAAARPRPGATGVGPLRADPPRQPNRAQVRTVPGPPQENHIGSM